MKYKNILFDLDGTLIDSKPGIVNSLRQALLCFEINPDTMDLNKFIGPPLMNTLVDTLGMDHQKAGAILKKYREYYGKTGVYDNSLYDGVEEMLVRLKADGHTLYIATAKPLPYTNIVLEHFNILQYFTYVAASDLDRTFDTKQRIIEDVLNRCNITDLNSAVMIGDTKHDIIAAKAVGMDAIGVLYGYGDYEELAAAGADCIVKSIKELTYWIAP